MAVTSLPPCIARKNTVSDSEPLGGKEASTAWFLMKNLPFIDFSE
jgi:hypothetical protein